MTLFLLLTSQNPHRLLLNFKFPPVVIKSQSGALDDQRNLRVGTPSHKAMNTCLSPAVILKQETMITFPIERARSQLNPVQHGVLHKQGKSPSHPILSALVYFEEKKKYLATRLLLFHK